MFHRLIEWPKAVAMVCDIAKGNATVSLRYYSKRREAVDGRIEISGWDYRQLQAHRRSDHSPPSLVTVPHLAGVLLSVSRGREHFFAYEVEGSETFEEEANALLLEFDEIFITTVKLTVGSAVVSWFLISFEQNRDTVRWKMLYHERDRRPGLHHA